MEKTQNKKKLFSKDNVFEHLTQQIIATHERTVYKKKVMPICRPCPKFYRTLVCVNPSQVFILGINPSTIANE